MRLFFLYFLSTILLKIIDEFLHIFGRCSSGQKQLIRFNYLADPDSGIFLGLFYILK